MKVSPPNNAMMSNEAPPVEADHSPVPLCVCVCAHWTAMSTSFFCWHYQTHSDKKKYSVATLRIEEKKNGSIGQVSVCLPDCAMFTVDIKIPPIDQRFFFGRA